MWASMKFLPWCEWWTKMAANLNDFKTAKKDCILSKSNEML